MADGEPTVHRPMSATGFSSQYLSGMCFAPGSVTSAGVSWNEIASTFFFNYHLNKIPESMQSFSQVNLSLTPSYTITCLFVFCFLLWLCVSKDTQQLCEQIREPTFLFLSPSTSSLFSFRYGEKPNLFSSPPGFKWLVFSKHIVI